MFIFFGIFCCRHLRDPGISIPRSLLARNSKVAEIVYISRQRVELSSFGLPGHQPGNSLRVNLRAYRLCIPCISISKPLLATLFSFPSCSDLYRTTFSPGSHLSLLVLSNLHFGRNTSLLWFHYHALSRPILGWFFSAVKLALAKSDLRRGAVHHPQPFGAVVLTLGKVIVVLLMVLEQSLFNLAILFIKVMLVIRAFNTHNAVSPPLLNKFHSSLQSHFLFLNLTKLSSHFFMSTDFVTSFLRQDNTAFIISFFDIKVLTCRESSRLLDF